MRLLLPDPIAETGSPKPETPTPETPAVETPPAPAPETPAIVARTSTDRTPRERELEIRLAEMENERDNLKRALYEPKTVPIRLAKPKAFLASVEAELLGKG